MAGLRYRTAGCPSPIWLCCFWRWLSGASFSYPGFLLWSFQPRIVLVEIASMLLRDLLCGVEECCALSVEWFSSEYWRDRKGVYCHTAYDMHSPQ